MRKNLSMMNYVTCNNILDFSPVMLTLYSARGFNLGFMKGIATDN